MSNQDLEKKFHEDKWTAMQLEQAVWTLQDSAKKLDVHSTQHEIITDAIGQLIASMKKLGF